MNRRAAYVVALTGVLAVVGSCAPLGRAFMHATHPHPAQIIGMTPGQPLADYALVLAPGHDCRVALELTLAVPATDSSPPAGRTHAQIRYRLPVSIALRAGDGVAVASASRTIDWTEPGTHTRQPEAQTAGVGRLTLAYEFPRFKVPASGQLLLDVVVSPDRDYAASPTHISAKVYEDPGSDAVAIAYGVFMLLAGWIAATTGVALVITTRTSHSSTAVLATSVDGGADARRRAMFCHLVGFAGYVLPFANVAAVAIIWLRTREQDPYIDRHGREALNFQLSFLVYLLIAFALSLAVIGILMLPLLLLFHIVNMIEAAVQAQAGRHYRYPLTFRFLRAPPEQTLPPTSSADLAEAAVGC